MVKAPPESLFPAQRFALALLSGEVGFALMDRLNTEFLEISRHDVFYGCVLALSDMHAGLVVADYEARILRQQLEQRSAA